MMNIKTISIILLIIIEFNSIICLPPIIKIGGLFDTSEIDNINEKMFHQAIEKVNEEKILGENTKLVGITTRVPEQQGFEVQKRACKLVERGCIAIFGPRSPATTPIVESVCDTKEVPHIQTRWYRESQRGSCSINLYPQSDILTEALVDTVKASEWKYFTILFHDDDGLYRVKKLLEMYENKDGYKINLRQLDDENYNFRKVLKEIKKTQETYILIDAPTDILLEVLKQAQQVGLMSSEQSYIINNLDSHTLDLEPFMHSGTKIAGIRLLNLSAKNIENKVRPELVSELESINISLDKIQLESILIYDAVLLLAQSIVDLPIENDPNNVRIVISDDDEENENQNPDQEETENKEHTEEQSNNDEKKKVITLPATCSNGISWQHGYSIINEIRTSDNVLLPTLSGPIKFDNQGFRTNFQLELTTLIEDEGMIGIGKWTQKTGVKFYHEKVEDTNFKNKTLIVMIALTPPYAMEKESKVPLQGNDRYEGYAIDLIYELSEKIKFNYTFVVQTDTAGGSFNNTTQKWDGMIGKILDGDADLAIADLTITRDREQAVDFSMPFMNLGISILYKKPKKSPPSLFSFLDPYSGAVWIYVIAAYAGVSVLLFLMARISPYEWNNPYPCIDEPDELENQFTLSNSFWFTIGSLMQQGSEIAPIAVSTRMVAGIWWFFTLIMVSSYTANLAAFLTVENNVQPFRDVEELEAQSKVKYGAKHAGTTAKFFASSENEVYKRMHYYMAQHYNEVMVPSNEAGVNRVNDNDDYAFLMESTSIEYIMERKCNLTQVGGLLDNKGYGIAMHKSNPIRNLINIHVLALQESGVLRKLKDTWWKEKGAGTCSTSDKDDAGGVSGLTLANVGGVFLVLVVGIIFSIFVAFAEMFYHLWRISVKNKVSLKKELLDEWKFISKCHGSVKPVRRYGSSADESTHSDIDIEEATSFVGGVGGGDKTSQRDNISTKEKKINLIGFEKLSTPQPPNSKSVSNQNTPKPKRKNSSGSRKK